ncbi:hypothetical protein BCR33DRAFT_182442 [Rhizoclosmatium globosum]|uniref:TPR-like protein n=1 Tax=Rhizoclosmatium globosum TaxID=329046 RepID=A0A1Y2D321_9FUNG|nr:hypothetical protein BCR33DRAFT_182442 [Rhizoclosmatium globosum]|eukprot:ORY52955.1 hypothetical protein BCR33DRAFT_182442 [Rhizoclosmatium globosum]
MESNNLAQFVDAVVDNCPMESFEPAVATIRNILTPGHPIYTSCLKKLAKFYLDIGNYEGAQKLAFEAVKRESCEHGTESTEALYAKIILLKVYLQSMQLYEARSLADSILNAVEVNSIFWFEVMNIKERYC